MQTEILSKLDELLALQHQLLKLCSSLDQSLPAAEWLDNTDVKNLLKISDSSLYRMRKSKLLPATQIAGKWYYSKLEIAKIIAR
ncbi:MAG: DNA-binding protein [Flavobacteriales bacterium]|nr:MAG: DNA-binding protein [Flavobacteriales bacterium]